jgi:GNAT superfamily N-acetyltransferase
LGHDVLSGRREVAVSDRVTVGPASVEDGQRILPLARDMATSFALDAGTFAASLAELLGRDDAIVLVAREAERVVGYLLGFDHLAFYANGRVAYVEEVAVGQDRRRAKIGQQLMQEFEAWAAARSAILITVATRRAVPFYRALGYEETATLFRKVR